MSKNRKSQVASRKSVVAVVGERRIEKNRTRIIEKGPARPTNQLWEAFEGARWSGYRGWWFFPQLDTSRTMTQWTREQIARKEVWGYNNIPELHAVIDGLGIDEVDTAIWPKARTSNPAFNKAVTDRFDEENKDPRSFDLRQVETAYSGQFLIRRSIRLFGDIFGQLVRPFVSVNGLQFAPPPRMGFLPGYQCQNGDVGPDDPYLRDGVRFDPETGAPSKFRFALPRVGDYADQKYTELDAADVLHFHDPFLADQIRGIGTLAPFVRQMFSMDDIDRAETSGQLLRSRIAYAVETVGADEGTIPKLPGVVDSEVIENPDGSKTVIQKIISRDGTEVDVYTPPSGMKIKTLESNRGGAIDFRNFLARGLMHCTVYPPEWILFIAGLSQGTVARVVQNRVQKIANFYRAMQLDTQYMQRWYRFWLWKRISAGVFNSVEGGVPADWFRHKLIYPRDMSVDLGREGKLYDDRVMRGNMSWSEYHALRGKDDDDEDEEILEKAFDRRRKLKEANAKPENKGLEVKYEEVWRLPPGTANVAAAAETGADEKLAGAPGAPKNRLEANGAHL